ncbi:MAG: succinylglutamate desuccinylase/aspartoacylase family protein [Rhodobacteraceae bacterium]|nr:succinylglutamate desuccinylase/aspartoacylase family protein [Paracoccaceae bacterium]
MKKFRTDHVDMSIDLTASGKQHGDIRVRWSDNSNPLGYHAVPVICVANGHGPTALLIGGVHGDEFEGPCALLRLASSLRANRVAGRVIIVPALNPSAVSASTRTSPLDGVNMNRTFPGKSGGSISQLTAHFVEVVLVALADFVIDLHSGGRASVFEPCSLVSRAPDSRTIARSMQLAEWFGIPTLWLLGELNDDRSVNSAADRSRTPMIAVELGGGGGCDPALVDLAGRGIANCLSGLGMLSGNHAFRREAKSIRRVVEISDLSHSVFAPARGLFERRATAGDIVMAGQDAGALHRVEEPELPPRQLAFREAGLVLAHTNRGIVNRGELLLSVATPVNPDDFLPRRP